MRRVNLHYFFCFLIFFTQNATSKKCKKEPMPGEHLTPSDFEKAIALVVDKHYANDMTIDDGTTNDIIESKKPQLRSGSADTELPTPWPNGIVPYVLDSSFNEADRALIAKGILLIQDTTCVKFITRTTETDYVFVEKNTKSTSCSSSIGMQGGEQTLILAQRCIDRFGSTTHEFVHAIGFHHEQTRMDRDETVIVRYENIKEGYESQFDKKAGVNTLTTYDVKSISHYSNIADSKNGKHTIDVKADSKIEMGQREKLTALDIKKIQEFYKCSVTPSTLPLFTLPGTRSSGSGFDKDEEANTKVDIQQIVNDVIPCKDIQTDKCKLWKRWGFCRKSQVFMSFFCKLTCNQCHTVCSDLNRQCGEWARKNYCTKYKDYMHNYCRGSCKLC